MQALLARPQVALNTINLFSRPPANNIVRLGQGARVANNIVKFARPAIAVGTTALVGKAALLAGAFAVGYGIGTALRQLWAFLNSPNSKPNVVEPTDWSVIPRPAGAEPGQQLTYVLTGTYTESSFSRVRCTNGQPVADYPGRTLPISREYRCEFIRTIARTVSTQLVCPAGTDGPTVTVIGAQRSNSDGSWSDITNTKQTAIDGTNYGVSFAGGPLISQGTWTEIKTKEFPEPLPLPQPEVIPSPRPLPLPMPQADPEVMPKKPQVVPIVKPAPKEVPDAQPTTEPAPEKTPTRKPVRIWPKIKPANKPKTTPTTPATTTQTTIAGRQVPPNRAIVPTTPGDIHKFGNRGGRVAGRTASINPTQMAQEMGRVEQKLNALGKAGAADMDFEDMFNLLKAAFDLINQVEEGTTYKLQAVCECPENDDQCEEPEIEKEIPTSWWGDASIQRLDAIAELLQPLKSWKQPICNEKVQLAGDFRTIAFISDDCSPDGNSRLRKRFRYRSQSGADLDTLVDHWKDFQWNAGPVCVQHSGHSWGTPQVWAASVDEGKRVILHAGREAGVDPNKTGKWTVSGSNNPRFGMSGRMRVNTKGGYYWITERLGSSGRPLVHEL